uniref:Uncharacterized protein n=1 Tax=Lactuca sativa TaxID=4236 RepID=A0A9R1VUU5_LACSA|nr:hypothetical protein LSAT_V11C400192240 [Lactuca sativa]
MKALSSDSKNESSGEEASGRGYTHPRSPTPEIPVRTLPPLPPPVTIPASIPPIYQTTTSQHFTSKPIPTPIFTDTTSTTTTKPTFTIPNPPTNEPPTTSKPLSPTPSTETTPILGGEDLEFDSTYFSPYRVQSEDDDDEPIIKRHLKAVNDKLNQLLSSSSSGAYSDVALKALFLSFVAEHLASLSTTAKAIEASTSQCQQASRVVDASTKECKDATAKVDKLVSHAHIFLDYLQAVAAKNAVAVTSSVETLQQTLQSECSKVEAARLAIQQANEAFHANSSTADIYSILLHLIEGHDPLVTITTRRHLADKLRPALDVLSRIEGVPVTGVYPQQGGEKEMKQEKQEANQPPPSTSKPAAEPKGNEASVLNGKLVEDVYMA